MAANQQRDTVSPGERFVHALARINRAITDARSIEAMLTSVLDEMLDIFDCERAALLYPCDPSAPTWSVPMARTRPGWIALQASDGPQPMTDHAAYAMRLVRAHDGPVRFDPGENPLDPEIEIVKKYSIRSQLAMTLYPKNDQPWQVVVHHCTEPRVYGDEIALFQAIGHRLADGITTLVVNNKLRQSEARYRALVDNAPEAILIVDSETDVVLEANPRARTLFGGAITADTGARFADFSPQLQPDGRASRPSMAEHVARLASGQEPVFEWAYLDQHGGEVACEVRLAVLPGPPNNLVRVSIADITKRKREEREREKLHEQLVHAQRLEVVGLLTGGLAHDFNNMLTVINTSFDLIALKPGLPPGVESLADEGRAAVERAATSTRDLLAYARRQVLRPRAVDVVALLGKMEQLLRRAMGERISIAITHSPEIWHCRADPTQLENALFNLAVNARDAMPQGGQLVFDVSHAVVDQDSASDPPALQRGDYVMITVSDTGRGMSPALQEQVFDPFFTTKPEGSGLGLSMVFGLVKQLGGHIRLHSEVDRGTSFELLLPRAHAALESSSAAVTALADLMGSGEKILIVENEAAVRKLTVRILDQLGYQTFAVGSAQAALDLLAEHQDLDLLLSDVVLPGKVDGVQLSRRVRQERPGLPILLTSGYTSSVALQDGDFTPAVDLLQKPYSQHSLATFVHRALQHSRSSSAK